MARHILLIDDDRMQFRLTQAQFDQFAAGNFVLEWAATYEDGLERLLGGRYDACLLDYQLGERDGLRLIREAVTCGCHTPIIFLTAETARRVDEEAMNAGALDYLVKGEITPRALERSLRYALKLGETLAALRRLATRDELTGLFNRREFDRMLGEERERAASFGHPLALVLIDIDHFKAVNDTHGHPIGDGVLREVARRIAGQVRSVDRVARIGGEEFGILLVQGDATAAREVAVRIVAAVAREPVQAGSSLELMVTVSAGTAVLPQDAASEAALIARADKALYAAKERGRNCVAAAAELAPLAGGPAAMGTASPA